MAGAEWGLDEWVDALWVQMGQYGYIEGNKLGHFGGDPLAWAAARMLIRGRLAHYREGRLTPMSLGEQIERMAGRRARRQVQQE